MCNSHFNYSDIVCLGEEKRRFRDEMIIKGFNKIDNSDGS